MSDGKALWFMVAQAPVILSTSIAVAHATSPYISAYPWSGSGFGSKFSNPSVAPAVAGNGVAFD